jgi:hypothetical protein
MDMAASSDESSCTIFFDNGTASSVPLSRMATIIPSPHVWECPLQEAIPSCLHFDNSTQRSPMSMMGSFIKGSLASGMGFIVSFINHM